MTGLVLPFAAARPPAGVGVPRLRVLRDMADARDAWARLEAHGAGYPFQGLAWSTTLMETMGPVRQASPAIVVVEDAQGPAMLLPLLVRPVRGLRQMEFIDFGLADYNAPLLRRDGPAWPDGAMARLWPSLLAAIGPVDRVRFAKMPDRVGPLPNPLLGLGTRPEEESWQADISDGFEAFLKRRSSRFRKDCAAKARELARQGVVRFQMVTEPAPAAALLEELLRLKSAQYRRTGRVDLLRDPTRLAFYRAITAREGRGGMVCLSSLTLDGVVVAANLGLAAGGRFYSLLPAYLPEHARLSPGKLLNHELVRWCCGAGLAVFDLTCGGEPYKQSWTDGSMPLHGFRQDLSAAGWLLARAERAGTLAKQGLRARVPRLFAALRDARTAWLNGARPATGTEGGLP